MFSGFAPIARSARATFGQNLRAIPVHAKLLRPATGARCAVFLPAYGPKGAALLRIYQMAQALEARGWRCLVLPPGLGLVQRHRFLRRAAPDVIVMQGARHALNRPALYPEWPIVFDMDDADFHLPHLQDPVQRAMPDVAAVIAGSNYIADRCLGAGAPCAHVVWTGTPVSNAPRSAPQSRPEVVAWAQTRPMTYQAEAAFVARVMASVASLRPGVTLRLYDRQPGDDPGFADRFKAPGLHVEWLAERPYAAFLASFEDVAVGLAPLFPSAPFVRGKSFGKVLAYLDRKVPVVASDVGEHGRFFTPSTGVLSNKASVWEGAIVQLLGDGAHRCALADAAFEAFKTHLSLEAAASRTDRVLRDVMGARHRKTGSK